tara:strand:- start:110 stop:547 length:438 start_codon:yes stop_codon:yes gene_type:complete
LPITVKHRVFGRVRFCWEKQYTCHEVKLMEISFLYHFPDCFFRSASGNKGCVILFDESKNQLLYHQLTDWIQNFTDFAECQGPLLPPSKSDILIGKVKGWTAQSMIVMAILGWILPILPGTPFFLVAWWLGWRPSSTNQSVVAEP